MEIEKKTNFVILAGGNIDLFQQCTPELIKSIYYMTEKVRYTIIEETNIAMIEDTIFYKINDKNDAVIVISNRKDFSTKAYNLINEIIDCEIPNKLEPMIKNLEENLEKSFECVICGIINHTLIISFYGTYRNDKISKILKENKEVIMQIISLVKTEHELLKEPVEQLQNEHNNLMPPHEGDDNSNVIKSDDTVSSHEVSEEKAKEIPKETLIKRRKPNNMISMRNAVATIRNVVRENEEEVNSESADVSHACDRILAENTYSTVNVPPYETSAKDGFAVLASDGKGIRRIAPTFIKGMASVVSGTCMQVKSGAPIPNGATAVVALENAEVIKHVDYDSVYSNTTNMENKIEVLIAPEENENIKNAGCEVERGKCILEKYSCLGPMELHILTLCLLEKVPVIKIPSVGILSIGDIDRENPRKNSTLNLNHETNTITVDCLLLKNSYSSIKFGIAGYKADDIAEKIQEALAKVDVLVTMGHANDKDFLKIILKKHFKATIYFGLVNMKPGKSTIFATCTVKDKKKYLLCMSANPTTVPIVTQVLLLPLLDELHCNYRKPFYLKARVDSQHELHSRPKFSWTTLQWTETEEFPIACSSKNQHQIKYGNALILLPALTLEKPMLEAGEFVHATFFGERQTSPRYF